MKIEQLNITKENAWEILSSDGIYLIRFSNPQKKSEGHLHHEVTSYPHGLSFKNLRNISISELVKLVESGEGAIVKVTRGES